MRSAAVRSTQLSDTSDPGVRAALRLRRTAERHTDRDALAAMLLVGLGVAAVALAEPVTGRPGATVGAVVGAIVLTGLAVALWPQPWSTEEHRHRRLEAIWHEARPGVQPALWEQYVAWAEPERNAVRLSIIRCAPETRRVGGAPSPYRETDTRRVGIDDIAAAAEAMENLRIDAERREGDARARYEQRLREAEQAKYDAQLQRAQDAADARIEQEQRRLEQELAAEEAADRDASAYALARALRRQ